MRNKTIEFSLSDETPRGGAGGLHDLVIGMDIPLRPQNLNFGGVCILLKMIHRSGNLK